MFGKSALNKQHPPVPAKLAQQFEEVIEEMKLSQISIPINVK